MDVSSQMITFAKVVEMGSISAASRASGQTPSALSKQIRHLEDHVGHRLLHRSKSGVSVTDEGRDFYQMCRAVAEKVHEAEDHISSLGKCPRGTLHVASSVAFGKAQLIPALPEFLARHPDVAISLELTDRAIDLEEEHFDVSVNFAEQLNNPNVIVRKIMSNQRVLCAAPAYLDRHGTPKDFADLANHNCLRTSNAVGRNTWQATCGGKTHTVQAGGNFEGNSADAVLIATLAGLGIARLSTYLVASRIGSGELVRILPDYTQDHADVAVTFADKRNLAPRIRAFVQFLADRFNGGPRP